MCRERLRPRLRRAVFETVAATYDSTQPRRLVLFLREPRRLCERVRDDFAAGGPEAVVVQPEDFERAVGREEGDDGVDGASAERVIAQVYLDERRLVLERVAYRGESLWNLVDQTTGENVGKVGDLKWVM